MCLARSGGGHNCTVRLREYYEHMCISPPRLAPRSVAVPVLILPRTSQAAPLSAARERVLIHERESLFPYRLK